MAFTTHVKALSTEAEAKLQKVKAKYRLHKTKAAGKTNTAGETNAVDSIIMAKDKTPEAAPNTNAEVKSKAEVDHKTKCQPEIKVQAETSVQPEPTNQEEQGNTSKPSQSGEEVEKANPAASPNACKKLQKLARRMGRRQARKAKWATRRAAFRSRAHRFGEAAFLPVAIIAGIIFGPVLIAWDLAMCVVSVAGWIVVKIVDLACAPFVACYYICRELKW